MRSGAWPYWQGSHSGTLHARLLTNSTRVLDLSFLPGVVGHRGGVRIFRPRHEPAPAHRARHSSGRAARGLRSPARLRQRRLLLRWNCFVLPARVDLGIRRARGNLARAPDAETPWPRCPQADRLGLLRDCCACMLGPPGSHSRERTDHPRRAESWTTRCLGRSTPRMRRPCPR